MIDFNLKEKKSDRVKHGELTTRYKEHAIVEAKMLPVYPKNREFLSLVTT